MQEKIITLAISERVKGIGAHVGKAAARIVEGLKVNGVITEEDTVTVRAVKQEGVRRGSVSPKIQVTTVIRDADGNIATSEERYKIG